MAVAGVLELQLVADVARLRQDMDRMQGVVARGAKQMERALDSVRGHLEGLFTGASVVGFGMWIKSAIDFQDELNDLNKTTGISVERLGGLALMSKQTGSDLTGIAQAMNKLTMEMGKAPDKFRAIGITAKDPLEAFKQLSEIFRNIEDPQLRAAVAAQALGKGWTAAAPALAEGAKAIDEMVKRGSDLVGATGAGAAAADEFNDKVSELQMAIKGASIQLANGMLPLLTQLAQDLTDTAEEAKKADYGFDPLTETLRALAIVGGNVGFVFRAIGIEIGGITAQIAAFARGDFAQIGVIHDEMVRDAERNREAFDAWEKKILSLGKTTKEAATLGGEADRELRRMQEAARQNAAAIAANEKALRDFAGVNKEATNALDGLLKKIRERIEASQMELTLGRQLTDEEKFRIQTEASFQELAKKYPGLSKAKVQALLAESAALSQQLDIRKAEQAANTEFAKQWAKDEEDMAAAQRARADERNRVLAGINDQAKALEDSNAQLELERALIGASAEQRELATGSLEIELKLKRQIEEINQNLLLDEQARALAIGAAQQNAAEARRQLGERVSIGNQMGMADDVRGALRDGLMQGFRDGKFSAETFATNLANVVYKRLSDRIADALTETAFGGGKGGGAGAGGLFGGLLSGFSGSAQAALSQTGAGSSGFGTGLAYGNQDVGAFLHSGGIVGSDISFGRAVNDSVFHGAPRFHTGGIAGDEVPIIAQRGEGVFTPAQMRALGGGGGQTVTVQQNIQVGDFVSRDHLREELAASERRMAAGIRRATTYGRG